MGKREEKYKARTNELITFDRAFADGDIAGMDEVGRGPLAGDVVSAFVIMPKEPRLIRIDDSKKLSQKAREEIAMQIREIALFIGIGKASPEEIDKYNILEATKLAMHRAAEGVNPSCLLVDAVKGLNLPYTTYSVIKGDAKSYAIACASVIAKVERDNDISLLSEKYPQYLFHKNKGYGTAEHIAALKKYGPCPIHRRSFIKNFVNDKI